MKKITELTEIRWRTIHYKDALGNRHREQEQYVGLREVKTIKTGERFAHHLLDYFIYYIIMIGFVFILEFTRFFFDFLNSSINELPQIAGSIFLFLLLPLYYFFSETFFQTTIGKLATQSIVIDEYGNKPSVRIILLRSIIRLVPFNPLSCLGDKYSYGWHDKWSNTWVVTKSELYEIRKLQLEQKNESIIV